MYSKHTILFLYIFTLLTAVNDAHRQYQRRDLDPYDDDKRQWDSGGRDYKRQYVTDRITERPFSRHRLVNKRQKFIPRTNIGTPNIAIPPPAKHKELIKIIVSELNPNNSNKNTLGIQKIDGPKNVPLTSKEKPIETIIFPAKPTNTNNINMDVLKNLLVKLAGKKMTPVGVTQPPSTNNKPKSNAVVNANKQKGTIMKATKPTAAKATPVPKQATTKSFAELLNGIIGKSRGQAFVNPSATTDTTTKNQALWTGIGVGILMSIIFAILACCIYHTIQQLRHSKGTPLKGADSLQGAEPLHLNLSKSGHDSVTGQPLYIVSISKSKSDDWSSEDEVFNVSKERVPMSPIPNKTSTPISTPVKDKRKLP